MNIDNQKFIDINIDSECETSIEKPKDENNNDKKNLFKFSLKRSQSQKSQKSEEEDSQKDRQTQNISINEAADMLLNNLSEIGLDTDDDEEEDEDESEDENLNLKNIVKISNFDTSLQELNLTTKRETILNSSTYSDYQNSKNIDDLFAQIDLNDQSTPLNKYFSSFDNFNKIDDKSLLEDLDKTLNELDNLKHNSKQTIFRSSSAGTNKIQKNSKLVTNTQSLGFNNNRNDSLVDGLLGDIYDRFNVTFKENLDSDVFTEQSMSSSRYSGIDHDTESNADQESESKHYSKNYKLTKPALQNLDTNDLKMLIEEMSTKINQMSTKLIRQLKQKDKFASKLNRNCDIITAFLQAKSLKRRVDTQMKFTLNPMPGEAGYIQWKDAMKALIRLPGGVPKEFRKSIWLNLSKNYINSLNIDWVKTRRAAFNDRSNPDDDELGIQIVKDLHRTGCSAFSGHENEQDRALLKRVLLAYARYNKSVGYCQGFNIIAALILEIVEKREEDALMCLIYLIDHVLPEGYFTNSMHTLAIDMAVFRELLRQKLPKLYQHLNELQFSSTSANLKQQTSNNSKSFKLNNLTKKLSLSQSNSIPSKLSSAKIQQQTLTTYEPPLTNVFTMQWFLTLFATCLSKNVLLRVWDCIFLEGSEILFRTSIAIWDKLSISVMKANSADSFYSMMSILSVKLFDSNVIDENDLIDRIYSYGSFPLIGLHELREKFTFNITPFQINLQNSKKFKNTDNTDDIINLNENNSINNNNNNNSNSDNSDLKLRSIEKESNKSNKNFDEDDDEVEDLAKMISCFALLMPNRSVTSSNPNQTQQHQTHKDIMIQAVAAASALGINKINKQVSSSILNKIKSEDEKNLTELNRVTPGAFSFISQMYNPKPLSEQLTLDLNELKKQYKKLKERQKQAQIIIQTASTQHRLKLSNSNNPSQLKSFSNDKLLSPSPFSLEAPPVINHLLIKPNDSTRNTLKTTIHLNTPNEVLNESLIDKINSANKTMIDTILHEPSDTIKDTCSKQRKVSKPYFSDEDEDDDVDEENEDDYDTQTEEFEHDNTKLNSNINSNIIDTPTKMSLIELANLNENLAADKNRNLNLNQKSSTSSSASTSSISSPVLFNKMLKNQGEKDMKIKKLNKQKATQASIIIEHLVKEESRNKTPINPFPTRHINSNIAKNGLRLGLYK